MTLGTSSFVSTDPIPDVSSYTEIIKTMMETLTRNTIVFMTIIKRAMVPIHLKQDTVRDSIGESVYKRVK